MKFNLPLNCLQTDYAYFDMLNHESTHSVYFAGISVLPDARNQDYREQDIENALSKLRSGIKRNLLLNGIMSAPSMYQSPGEIITIAEKFIHSLMEKNLVDGIIVHDLYLLGLLKQRGHIDLSKLSIIPTINFMLDSIPKIESNVLTLSEVLQCDYVPEKIVLDRSLNRDLNKLAEISAYVRERFPNTLIELLANEGCRYQCQFKSTHDATICVAAFADRNTTNTVYKAHDDFGCIAIHKQTNYRSLLASPFLRPEDIAHVAHYCDIIKLCGRKLNYPAMKKIVEAYRAGEYHFNLLDLIEAPTSLTSKLYVFGDSFPPDFYYHVSYCNKRCTTCNYCADVLAKNSQVLK